MQCPKCEAAMESAGYQGIEVNRCTGCKGLFFRPGSASKLKKLWRSDFLDSGDAKVGRKYNRVRDINCPSCSTKMVAMQDEKQKHIGYENCPSCGGCYFDAGEFTDWKYETLMDRVRDVLQRAG